MDNYGIKCIAWLYAKEKGGWNEKDKRNKRNYSNCTCSNYSSLANISRSKHKLNTRQ